jgi:Holliday junction resolvase RusA-like endonuclease
MPNHSDAPENIEQLDFWVEGIPIPQGSKRGYVIGRRAVIVDDNAPKLKPWRLHVHNEAVKALAGRSGFGKQHPVRTTLDFYMPRPKTVTRARPCVKPDADKLERSVNDALTTAGVYADDSQVVSTRRDLWYADNLPGVHITVRIAE